MNTAFKKKLKLKIKAETENSWEKKKKKPKAHMGQTQGTKTEKLTKTEIDWVSTVSIGFGWEFYKPKIFVPVSQIKKN